MAISKSLLALSVTLVLLPTILLFEPQRAGLAQAPSATAIRTTPVRKLVETADFALVVEEVESLVTKHGSEAVLFVVDLDNTLLAMNQDLGSDQWFNWQADLLDKHPTSPALVATDFPGLLRAQGLLFATSSMHPPEPTLPERVESLQALGVTSIVLTSRGPEFRNSAERELKDNGYAFAKNALEIHEQRGRFLPYDPGSPDAHGLDATIIAGIVKDLRPVTYSAGIFMTAGQHKGYMLRALLARSKNGAKYKALVFVDDHKKHASRMLDAYRSSTVDVVAFRYSREDGNARAFENSSKRNAILGWQRISDALAESLMK